MAQQRAVEALRAVVREHPGETVLVVTHKHIRAILTCWLREESLQAFSRMVSDSVEPEELFPAEIERTIRG